MSKRTANPNDYNAIHKWIVVHHGNASKCIAKECRGSSSTYQWALKKGREYDWDIDCFMPLCASCHQLYDMTDEARKRMVDNSVMRKRTHCKNGHEYSKENTFIRKLKTEYGGSTWRERLTCRSANKKRFREKRKQSLNAAITQE